MEAWRKFVKNNIVYPESAKDSCIGGSVNVLFTVDNEGSVTNTQIYVGLRPDFNKATLQCLKKCPDFIFEENLDSKRRENQFIQRITFTPGCNNPIFLDPNFRKTSSFSRDKEIETKMTTNAVLKSAKLGWINCDRFIGNSRNQFTQYVANEHEAYINCYLIFHEIKSIMPSYATSTGFKFLNVPVGSKVTLVAISAEDDELKYDVQTFKAQKGHPMSIQLEKGDEEALKKLLKEQGV
jgi:TonB family protein